jgi:hypothetical protein
MEPRQGGAFSCLHVHPLLEQQFRIYACEEFVRKHSYTSQIGYSPAHLIDGMVRIHRPHRLDTAMARVTEEDREASHTRSDQGSKDLLVMAEAVVDGKVWTELQHQRPDSSGEHLCCGSHPYTEASDHS